MFQKGLLYRNYSKTKKSFPECFDNYPRKSLFDGDEQLCIKYSKSNSHTTLSYCSSSLKRHILRD